MERMPGKTPWTVSVSVCPGTSPSSELERLDLAIRKRREYRDEDELIEVWKSKIEWAVQPVWGKPAIVQVIENEYNLFQNWLIKRINECVGQPCKDSE